MEGSPARRSRLRPSAWPIAVKLALTLLLASILPMSATAAYNLEQSLASLEQLELRNLGLLATSTAGRIEQLVGDTQEVVSQVGGDAEVVEFVASPPADRARLAATVAKTLENVVHADPDVFSVFLLDRDGLCLASTNPENLGQRLAFRDYFQRAIGGHSFVSELLTGSTTRRAGVYFSHPILDAAGRSVGVAVLKLLSETLDRMVSSVHLGQHGRAFLVDRYGVIISHPDEALRYRSLAPLSAAVLALPVFDRRFSSIGVAAIEGLGRLELARVAVGAKATGHTSDSVDGERRVIGFSPLKTTLWTLIVEEPSAEFRAPLVRLERRAIAIVIGVGVFVTAIALGVARRIVRPMQKLTAAARAVERGDFDAARVDGVDDDEIGVLAAAFATMAAGLKERERERDVFGRVVSPEVREKLLGGQLGLGGETRWVAVLFSDIRGFSTMSEEMDPQAVVALLNEYLTEMAEAVRPFHGYINNFIGDAIVVVFGAPIARADVEGRSVAAALAMRARLAALNVRREARSAVRIETGIGICAGEVVAGQIGSLERMLYTVIGDAVNVASRLESLTKEYPGHPILATRAVVDALTERSGFTVERLGPIKIKGRVEPVDVCAVDAS